MLPFSILVLLIFFVTFPVKKHGERGLDLPAALPCLFWGTRQLPLGQLGLCFWIIAVDPQFMSSYELLEEIWFFGSSLN